MALSTGEGENTRPSGKASRKPRDARMCKKIVGAPRPTPSQRVDRAYLTRGGRGNTERARLGSVQTHNGAKRARATPRHTARARGRSPPSRSAGRVRVLAFSSGPFVAVAQGRDLGRETENTTRHPCGFCGFVPTAALPVRSAGPRASRGRAGWSKNGGPKIQPRTKDHTHVQSETGYVLLSLGAVRDGEWM